jgi:hypothetical protein
VLAPLHVEAVLQEENTGLKFVGTLDVEGGRTARITSWFLRPVDESRQTGPALDAQVRARVIDKTLSILKAEYVAPASRGVINLQLRERYRRTRLKSRCCCLLVIGLSLSDYLPFLAYPENNHECQISLIFLREWVAIRSHALPRGPGWTRR